MLWNFNSTPNIGLRMWIEKKGMNANFLHEIGNAVLHQRGDTEKKDGEVNISLTFKKHCLKMELLPYLAKCQLVFQAGGSGISV